ncbi:hypothetical protein RFI_07154 [Reticulomyxa filosa]|uniref:SAM domain-containing protein n=1 Tax=Reticulomyxa filosa TaxID=46433 RepID=X6NXH9_RETFI|nr:hypothetical protein RFI_07154 [Reticulomyxa filosa]|eukprot:ETO29972.1 hypothetical protein RFI_07154 [Reticulomyxa filosa]
MFDTYNVARAEVSQNCFVDSTDENSNTGGSQAWMVLALIGIGVGLYFLHQKVKHEEGGIGGLLRNLVHKLSGGDAVPHSNISQNTSARKRDYSRTSINDDDNDDDGNDSGNDDIAAGNHSNNRKDTSRRDEEAYSHHGTEQQGRKPQPKGLSIKHTTTDDVQRNVSARPKFSRSHVVHKQNNVIRSAREFMKGVLQELGYPAFAAEQYLKLLTDHSLTTVSQLEAMDKKDWKSLGYTDEIIIQITKELSNLDEVSKKTTQKTITDNFDDDLLSIRDNQLSGSSMSPKIKDTRLKDSTSGPDKKQKRNTKDTVVNVNEDPTGNKNKENKQNLNQITTILLIFFFKWLLTLCKGDALL